MLDHIVNDGMRVAAEVRRRYDEAQKELDAQSQHTRDDDDDHEEEKDTERGRAARARRHEDFENTHRRCAERILAVLKANGGIYVKVRLA